jgi:hypothetical protein
MLKNTLARIKLISLKNYVVHLLIGYINKYDIIL